MSVRVNLKPEIFPQLKFDRDQHGNIHHQFKGIEVGVDGEGIHSFLGIRVENVTVNGLFPAELILNFSAQIFVTTKFLRTIGRYSFRTASAFLSDADYGRTGGRSSGYWLNMTADNLEDLKALYEQILAGTIAPTTSHETEQLQPLSSRLLNFIRACSIREQRTRQWFRQAFGQSA